MIKKLKQMLCSHDYVLGDRIKPPYGYMPNGDHFICECAKCGKRVKTYLTIEQQCGVKKGVHIQ